MSYIDTLNKGQKNIDKAYDNQIAQINRDAQTQKEQIEKNTSNLLKQAYIKKIQNQNNIVQTMRASGISGGADEVARAQIDSNYIKGRADIKNQQILQNVEIDNQKNQSIADINLSRASQKYQHNANVQSVKDNEAQLKRSEAYNKLSMGIYSPDIAQILGISDSTVRQYIKKITG